MVKRSKVENAAVVSEGRNAADVREYGSIGADIMKKYNAANPHAATPQVPENDSANDADSATPQVPENDSANDANAKKGRRVSFVGISETGAGTPQVLQNDSADPDGQIFFVNALKTADPDDQIVLNAATPKVPQNYPTDTDSKIVFENAPKANAGTPQVHNNSKSHIARAMFFCAIAVVIGMIAKDEKCRKYALEMVKVCVFLLGNAMVQVGKIAIGVVAGVAGAASDVATRVARSDTVYENANWVAKIITKALEAFEAGVER